MGFVYTGFRVENGDDGALVRSGRLSESQVRGADLRSVLVDTGATHLALPTDMISALGLPLLRSVEVETPAGFTQMRVFGAAHVVFPDRSDTFSCVELGEGRTPLLGVIVMEALGLRPDLVNHRLELLPEWGPGTHFVLMQA